MLLDKYTVLTIQLLRAHVHLARRTGDPDRADALNAAIGSLVEDDDGDVQASGGSASPAT